MRSIVGNSFFFDCFFEERYWEDNTAVWALEPSINFKQTIFLHQYLRFVCHQTLHILLGRFFIEAHMLSDLGKGELLVVVEEVEHAHLVGGHHQVVALSSARQFGTHRCCAHGEVPLELTVVVLRLMAVELSEAVHACLDLRGD